MMQSSPLDASFHFAMQSDHAEPALHVALIMDGNGRWAQARGWPRVAGHRAGGQAARRVVQAALDLGIARLTLYAFSADNWQRPRPEVERIFWLLRGCLRLECERMRRSGARLEVIGRRDRLPAGLVREIARVEAATAAGTRLHVRVAVDYSSRESICRAASTLAETQDSHPPASRAVQLASVLDRGGNDVDLLIRTGGEKRLSDFLLWESAYAELLFLDRMWPDFTAADLACALADFAARTRRFGGLAAQTTSISPA